MEILITTAWDIWNNRNNIRQGATSKAASVIVNDAHQYIANYRKAANPHLPRQVTAPPESWKPPPPEWYKVNVDGAVFAETWQCGLGVMIRNDSGQIMGALSKKLLFSLGAMEAEAKAMECGIIFAWELRLRQVIIEGDS